MNKEKYTTFSEFYPYYLSEHRKSGTRIMHFIGTTFFFMFVALMIFRFRPVFIPLAIITPYSFAWVAHFFIEKNKPATFQYPFYSLMGDFRLYFELLFGKRRFDASGE